MINWDSDLESFVRCIVISQKDFDSFKDMYSDLLNDFNRETLTDEELLEIYEKWIKIQERKDSKKNLDVIIEESDDYTKYNKSESSSNVDVGSKPLNYKDRIINQLRYKSLKKREHMLPDTSIEETDLKLSKIDKLKYSDESPSSNVSSTKSSVNDSSVVISGVSSVLSNGLNMGTEIAKVISQSAIRTSNSAVGEMMVKSAASIVSVATLDVGNAVSFAKGAMNILLIPSGVIIASRSPVAILDPNSGGSTFPGFSFIREK